MASANNITLPKTFSGDTWDGLTWALTDAADDTEYAGTLTLARFQLQDSTGAPAMTLTSSDGITINDATPYAWSVTVEPRILSLAAGDYTFGLELTDDSTTPERVKTRLAGSIQILPDPCA